MKLSPLQCVFIFLIIQSQVWPVGAPSGWLLHGSASSYHSLSWVLFSGSDLLGSPLLLFPVPAPDSTIAPRSLVLSSAGARTGAPQEPGGLAAVWLCSSPAFSGVHTNTFNASRHHRLLPEVSLSTFSDDGKCGSPVLHELTCQIHISKVSHLPAPP